MNAKTPALLVLTLIFALVLCGTVFAGTPLQENQTGTVSGDLYYNASNPWASTTGGETNEVTQNNTLPAYTSIDSARVYVNVYSGSGTNNWPVRTTIKFDGNGDGDYDDPGELLGVEDMNIQSGTDGTVYWINDHCTKVYSDYQVWYDVKNLITSNNPSVYVKTESLGGDYDGRIKLIALVAAYNDGDNDQVHYWVLNGQDWINSGSATSTFNTSSFNGQATNATLNTVALTSTDGTYTFNNHTKEGNLTETGTYYKEHTWDVTSDITPGADSNLTYTNVGSSYKINLATLTIRETLAPPVANFTATPTNGYAPLTVQFTDTSTGTATGWAWDFNNDGIIDSTLKNPAYKYNNEGTYTVNLTVTGPLGTSTETKTNYITTTVNGLADTPWPKYQGNSQNTGQSPYNGPQTNNLLWTYPTGTINYASPVIGEDGTIYIGSYGTNTLYAINPDGTLKWSYITGGKIYHSAAIATDGTIYFGSYDSKFYALNPDGTLKWTYTVGSGITASPTIGADGTIYIGSMDKNLYAINPDGTLKWTYTIGGTIKSSATVAADGSIYLVGKSNFYALTHDGALKWTYTYSGTSEGSSPSIGSDGTIYFGTYNRGLFALTPNGTLKWKYTSTGNIYGSTPAIATDGTIYIGSYNGNLYAFNPDGTVKWSYSTGSSVRGSAVIGADGTIYFICGNDMIYALNPNGTMKWSYATGTAQYGASSPAIAPDGTLYIGSYDGNLYAFRDPWVPVADFTSDVDNGNQQYVPYTFQFTDTSLNIPTSWLWDFGDGTTSTDQNPLHTYTVAGNYSVSLTATNSAGNNTIVKTDYIIVETPPPDSEAPTVTANTSSGTYNPPIQVTLTATDNIDQNPKIYYTTDDTDPTSSSTLYTGPISLISTTTLKFIAVDFRNNTSPIQSETYTLIDTEAPNVTADYDSGHYEPVWNSTINSYPPIGSAFLSVNLTASDNSDPNPSIYYTLDGSDPTTSSTPYSEPIPILPYANTLLKFIAVDAMGNTSPVQNRTYNTYIQNDRYVGGRFNDGNDLVNTIVYAEGNIGVRILEYGGYRWLDYSNTATWTTSDLNIPVGATIISARLYQAWTWYADPHYTIQFNSHETQQHVAKYTDCIAGQYVFDVTEYFNVNGDNTAYITSGPANYGTMLVVIYESASEPYRQIWINEGSECLMQGPPFNGFTTFNNASNSSLSSAKVTTVMLSGESGDIEKDLAGDADYIVFNEQTFHRSGYGIGADPGIYYFDVTSALENGTNELSVWGQTYLNFAIGVLEVTLKPPVADFTADITTGNGPLTVQFTDNSTDTTGWSWDFNNDGIVDSTLQNPTWIYNNPGYYTVKLSVTGPGGEDEAIKTDYIFVNGPDLLVTGITPNSGTGNTLFSNGNNVISVIVKNQGTSAAPTSTLKVNIAGEEYTLNVPALGVGESATVTVTDNTTRSVGDSVPVNTDTDPNNSIPETNDSNNTLTTTLPVYNNGYRGKRYTNGNDIKTATVWSGNYNVIYSNGSAAYRSGSGSNWDTPYTATWTSTDLPIPAGTNVVLARLYQPYTWNTALGVPDWTAQFNGKTLYDLTYYTDTKSYGTSNYPSGLLVYDVTSLFQTNGNTLTLTKGAATTASLYGSYLVVIYEDPNTAFKRIYINDGADMLCSNPTYSTNDEQATAYANYNLNTNKMSNAQLVAILASAGDENKSKFFFNGQEYTGFWNSYNKTTQTGFSLYDITTAVLNGFNTAALQSYNNGTNGDNMVALGSILVITTDNQCPTVNTNIQGGLSRTTQTVTLTATDDQCTNPKIYYTLNGEEPTTNCTLYTGSISINSTTTLKFMAVDDVGNISPVQIEIYTIDNLAPVASVSLKGGLYNANKSIILTALDNVDTQPKIYYTLNGITPTTNSTVYTGPISINETTTLKFMAVDNLGNTSPAQTEIYTIDTTQPTITSVNPANNMVITVANKAIVITFSENIKAGSAFTSIKVTNPDGVSVKPLYKVINGKTLTLTRNGYYINGLTYTITLPTGSITDTAGNTLKTAFTSKFKMDFVKPTVTSVNPANNKVINVANKSLVITFSENIKAGSAFSNIKVTNPDGVKVKPLYKVINGKTLTLTRNGNYINGLTYTITLPTGSITDTAGNTITAFTSKFTVDFAKPTITSVNPKNNSSGFSLTAPITITFSENILEGINWSKITMKNLNTGKAVSFTKTKNSKTLTIKMTHTRLHKNTYQIYIPAETVKDNAENKQNTPYTLTFKTR